ncbi:MAG: ribosome maturation factor RimP, partial [Myxococcota bacterium]
QLRLLRQPQGHILRIILDRPGYDPFDPEQVGVTLTDCTNVSRDVSTALDLHEELLPGRYHLEVSSPGLDRPLVRLEDYERFQEREVKLKTRVPVGNRRSFQGKILGVDGETVRIEQDGTAVAIPFEAISKANLVYRF